MLLRSTPLGLNVFLWMLAFSAAIGAIFIRRRKSDNLFSKFGWFYVPLILFSAFFAWRDSNVLMLLDAGAILATLVMVTIRGQNLSVRIAGFSLYAFGAF